MQMNFKYFITITTNSTSDNCYFNYKTLNNYTITLNNYTITTTTTGPYYLYENITNQTVTSMIWQKEWTHSQQLSDGSFVEIPAKIIQNQQWDAWIAAEAIAQDRRQAEQDRRQAAREAYNQAQQETVRWNTLREAERITANARAKALLFEHLSKAQQQAWDKNQLFDKIINGATYRFTYGSHGNVSKIEDGHIVERFCIAPVAPHDGGILPVEDIVLAQMLFLQCDERAFRTIANVTRYPPQRREAAPPVVVETPLVLPIQDLLDAAIEQEELVAA